MTDTRRALPLAVCNPAVMGDTRKPTMLRRWLQHHLHPLNVWCRIGGRWTSMCRIYEKRLWQPYLRRLFGGSSSKGSEE